MTNNLESNFVSTWKEEALLIGAISTLCLSAVTMKYFMDTDEGDRRNPTQAIIQNYNVEKQ